MSKHTVAVMLIITTDDDRLALKNIDNSTAKATAKMRRAVYGALRDLNNVQRVVMVMPEELAKLMSVAHDIAAKAAGLDQHFPPADYIPPTRE